MFQVKDLALYAQVKSIFLFLQMILTKSLPGFAFLHKSKELLPVLIQPVSFFLTLPTAKSILKYEYEQNTDGRSFGPV